jgi:glycosyltransferase involved in cell wall biosynthesis
MRILYHHRIMADDGMRVHVDRVVDALTAEGHQVRVAGPAAATTASETPATRLRRRLPGWLFEGLELAYNVVAYRRLRRAAQAFDCDVIYERYNLYLLAGALLKRRLGVPLILEVNAPLVLERRTHGNLQLVRLARAAERAVWRAADAVLPVSDALARHVLDAGVAPERVHVIRNAVTADALSTPDPAADPQPSAAVTFGFVGFVRAWHGLERVIDVMAARSDVRFHVIGDGPARVELEAYAARLGVSDRLSFTGRVAHADVPGHLRAIDVALQPDVTPYASPLKVFDYMAARCAIVAPARPNVREILSDGVTALLFDPDAPGAFASAVDRLAGDPALRARLGQAAFAEIQARGFTWEDNARRIAGIAGTLTGGPTARDRAASAALREPS